MNRLCGMTRYKFFSDHFSVSQGMGHSMHQCQSEQNGQNEIVFDRLGFTLSILLLAAIRAKFIGPHGGFQVGK